MGNIVDNGNVMRWAFDGFDSQGNEILTPMDFPTHSKKYGSVLANKHWFSFNELSDNEYRKLEAAKWQNSKTA